METERVYSQRKICEGVDKEKSEVKKKWEAVDVNRQTRANYVIVSELWRSEVAKRVKMLIFCFFEKKRPLTVHVSKFCSCGSTATPIDVLCANFVKYGPREVSKQARCLLE